MPKKAITIGAGAAGLTAEYELLKRIEIIPVILEKSGEKGGISRATTYKGNRMDMGPHSFFSKFDRVIDWWLKITIFPLAENSEKMCPSLIKINQEISNADTMASKDSDKEMLANIITWTNIQISSWLGILPANYWIISKPRENLILLLATTEDNTSTVRGNDFTTIQDILTDQSYNKKASIP